MIDKRKILVTGANGQLGKEIQSLSGEYTQFEFIFTGSDTLSITDADVINNFFEKNRPAFCINCAAYTAVDKAESEAAAAGLTNATAVGYLAKACAAYNTKLIHISTDYVFDGSSQTPYLPEDATNPVSAYGKTKLKGEHLAQEYTDVIIIRTAWVYSSFGKNFVKTMMQLMTSKTSINVVSDQYGAPTYAGDLAAAILKIIVAEKWIPGIYHYSNEGIINWYEFAIAIRDAIASSCEVKAIPTTAYPTPAKRPAYSVLNTSKIKEVYNIHIPKWNESLTKCIEKIG